MSSQPIHAPVPQEQPRQVQVVMKNLTDTRLFFGGLASEMTDSVLRRMIEDITQDPNPIVDCFVNNDKAFAFVDFTNRELATRVKKMMDNQEFYGRTCTVRRANHKSSVFVRDIPLSVTNEIMFKGFEHFGPVDRAIVVSDAHGKHQRYGFVEFQRKNTAAKAVRECSKRLFCLAKNTPPIRVENFVPSDHEDGFPESRVVRTYKQVEQVSEAPHFLKAGTKQYEEFTKWKELLDKQAKEKAELKKKHTKERNQMLGGIVKALADAEKQKVEDEEKKTYAAREELMQKEAAIAKAQAEVAALRHRMGADVGPGYVTTAPRGRGGSLLGVAPVVVAHHHGPPTHDVRDVRLPSGALLNRPGPARPAGPPPGHRPNPALLARDPPMIHHHPPPGHPYRHAIGVPRGRGFPVAGRGRGRGGRGGSLLGPPPGRVLHHPAPAGAIPPGPKRRRHSFR